MTWPVTWPAAANIDAVDPIIKTLCEVYAVASLKALTLQRVGNGAVTIMPDTSRERVPGYYLWLAPVGDAWPLGLFYPGTVYPSVQDLQTTTAVNRVEALDLYTASAVTEVTVDGLVLDPSSYRLENDRYLIRVDGEAWPASAGDHFTVTYVDTYPVDVMGSHAAGLLAAEWLKLVTADKTCRLPKSVTNINRQGVTYQITPGMFPGGVTGIPEIDAYVMLFNPFGLKVRPQVYSLDLPAHRQVR